MDFRKIFSQAWEVFWNQKILWLFGLLSGIFAEVSTLSLAPDTTILSAIMNLFLDADNPSSLLRYAMWLIPLLSLLLGAFATAGIIQGNLLVEAGMVKSSFMDIVKAAWPYYWRVLGLSALLGIVGLGGNLLALGSVAVFFGMLWLLPVICFLAPVLWFSNLILPQAQITLIAEDLNLTASLTQGWRLVTRKIGHYLLVWLVLAVISFTVSSIISFPSKVDRTPLAPLVSPSDYLQDPATRVQPMERDILQEMIWSRVENVLMGVVGVFITCVWAQTYLEVRRKEALAFTELDLGP